jgi:hypothetical protein
VTVTSQEGKSLAEVLDRFPPIVVIDGEVTVLNAEDIRELALLLKRTNAAGLVVYQNNQAGIISRKTIANALLISAIALPGSERLYGNSKVSPRTFICRKCKPPRFYRPRQGGEVPTCKLHGTMERADT